MHNFNCNFSCSYKPDQAGDVIIFVVSKRFLIRAFVDRIRFITQTGRTCFVIIRFITPTYRAFWTTIWFLTVIRKHIIQLRKCCHCCYSQFRFNYLSRFRIVTFISRWPQWHQKYLQNTYLISRRETITRELLTKTIEMEGDINTCHLLFLWVNTLIHLKSVTANLVYINHNYLCTMD